MAVSAESRAIWEAVKANLARLNQCQGPHQWEIDPNDKHHVSDRMKHKRCKLCGGVVDALHAIYYNNGVEHGRKAQQEGR